MGKFDKDSLGNRQKQYEIASANYLIPKEPVILRVDGRAFHSFTKDMEKPFDKVLQGAMKRTMLELAKEIPNCVFGYTQSDEITLVLALADRISQQEYLAGKLQKITSLTASKTTRYFNQFFIEEDTLKKYPAKYLTAEFDCRAFNIPEWDVINNIIWRQQDAVRNSIEAVGHAHFTTKELHKKSTSQIMDMLMLQKNINWNTFSGYEKRGACCYRIEVSSVDGKTEKKKWKLEEDMPILTQDRDWFSKVTGLKED